MKSLFHPEFLKDIRRFQDDYAKISEGLAVRFKNEVDEAVNAVKSSPRRAGLRSFPFFVPYGILGEQLLFGSVIPSRSDPLTWLSRFSGEGRS